MTFKLHNYLYFNITIVYVCELKVIKCNVADIHFLVSYEAKQ